MPTANAVLMIGFRIPPDTNLSAKDRGELVRRAIEEINRRIPQHLLDSWGSLKIEVDSDGEADALAIQKMMEAELDKSGRDLQLEKVGETDDDYVYYNETRIPRHKASLQRRAAYGFAPWSIELNGHKIPLFVELAWSVPSSTKGMG